MITELRRPDYKFLRLKNVERDKFLTSDKGVCYVVLIKTLIIVYII